jgi:hypothetical protein
MSEDGQRTGFDAEYVKQLREEAASWRTKYRELEAQVADNSLTVELAKQGIKAEPSWVQVADGQSIAEAVAMFGERYPQLKMAEPSNSTPSPSDTVAPPRARTPKSVPPTVPNTTVPAKAPADRITSQNINEIKKDAVARAKLREQYRALLASTSNQPKNEF